METRKLIQSGPSTLVVALPKKWIEHNKLKKGDTIKIEVLSNKIIVSLLKTQRENSVFRIDLSKYSETQVEILLYAGFLSEKNEMVLTGIKNINFKKINKILKRIPYLKIEEKTSDYLQLKFIADPSLIDIKKEILRVTYNLENFFDVFIEDNYMSEELEDSYDTLVLQVTLLMKILKINFVDFSKNEILRYKQLLDSYYFLVKTCKDFTRFIEQKKIPNKNANELIKEAIITIKNIVNKINEDDFIGVLKAQEESQKRRKNIVNDIQKSRGKEDIALHLIINDLYKIIESIGYAYINNQ